MLNRVRSIAKRVLGCKDQPRGKESFSQCGEDLLIDYVLALRGITRPSYIDLGAHDPVFISNTALFYARGCRGINVEANPQLIQRFYVGRPDDINLNVGVAEKEGTLDFYIMTDSTLSTFSEEEMNGLRQHGHQLDRVESIHVYPLQTILQKHSRGIFPDILSIDVEGKDLSILRTIDFATSAPKVICVEAAEYSPVGAGAKKVETIDFLKQNGYFEYANTNLNAIMVNSAFWSAPQIHAQGTQPAV